MKSLRMIVIALTAVAVLAVPQAALAQAPASDPLSVAYAGIAAVNARDLNTLVNQATDNITIQVIASPPAAPQTVTFTGREQARAFWQQSLMGNPQARLVGTPRVSGNRVTWVQLLANDQSRSQGLATRMELEAVIQGGRVGSLIGRNSTFVPLAQFNALPAALPRTGQGTINDTQALATLGLAATLAGLVAIHHRRIRVAA